MRIAICAVQVPFTRGGAEVLVDSLAEELRRRGHEVEVIRLPFSWLSRMQVLKSSVAWRLLDLHTLTGDPVDLVIATRFPAYLLRHPNKVVWLIHQFRQVYDLAGTPFSEYQGTPSDEKTAAMVRAMDARTLGEARRLFTISSNTADRLQCFNGLTAEPLYPPPKMGEAYRSGDFGDYVLSVGRLDRMKRFDLLLAALAKTEAPVRCVIAGTGPEDGALRERARQLGLEERVRFAGFVPDAELLELYAGALGVFYAPYDEDYGYVTVEAMKSGKPVLTTRDAGGVLEFVEDGVNGVIGDPDRPRTLARALDQWFQDRGEARRLGEAGKRRVSAISWDRVIPALLGEAAV